jgi:threonine dehydrogenase-like Zn-dependent dehydrogenase
MKAVVFCDVGEIRVQDVPEPSLQEPTDTFVRLTASAICGTDLHFVRGSMSGMKPGTILATRAWGSSSSSARTCATSRPEIGS